MSHKVKVSNAMAKNPRGEGPGPHEATWAGPSFGSWVDPEAEVQSDAGDFGDRTADRAELRAAQDDPVVAATLQAGRDYGQRIKTEAAPRFH